MNGVLLSCGCSMTLGAELGEFKDYFVPNDKTTQFRNVDGNYRNEHRFPTLLAKKMGLSSHNIAKGGSSNYRTVRVLRDYFANDENPIPSMTLVQLTDASRFEIHGGDELCYDIQKHMDKSEAPVSMGAVIAGGIYSPDGDDINPIEEYGQIMATMGEQWDEVGWQSLFKYQSYPHTLMDLMRQILSLVDMFRQAQCRFYIMDMFALEGQMRRVIGDLETIEKSENLFIPKDSCQFITLHSNANIRKKYFPYLKKTNMLNNFRNLYNKVMAVPELSSIRYSEFTDKKNKEKFVGVMPHGHPDEKCHSFIADTIYNDMKEKRLW